VTPADDHAAVTTLLGRPPDCEYEIVARDTTGRPTVIRNMPIMRNGRPMPTLYWLVGKAERTAVSRLETVGGVRAAERAIDPVALADTHARYARERDALLSHDHHGPRPSGGVGGTRVGVKCLHAHYAWHLAGGDDPVGRWVAAHLEEDGEPQ